jgi:hypothetical protein
MLHHLTNHDPIPHHTPNLLRKRTLAIIRLPTLLSRYHYIHAGALTRQHLGVEAGRTEVDGGAVDLIEQHGRHDAVDLQLEAGRLDDVETGDERVDEDGEAGAVVDGDGVGLAAHPDHALAAAGDEDAVRELGGDVDHLRAGVVVVLDDPFVAVQVFARGFLGPHAFRFGALGGDGRFAARLGGGAEGGGLRVAAFGDAGAGAEGWVLVRHFRLVDFAEARGDGGALVQLVENGGHVAAFGCAVQCWGKWWRCWTAVVVERLEWWRRRWSRGAVWRWWCYARLDLLESFHGVDAILVVPCQASWKMLLDICYKSIENSVICLDVFHVRFVPAQLISSASSRSSVGSLLVFVVFQDIVSIVLRATQYLLHKLGWPRLYYPAQGNYALCYGAQMYE